MLRRSSRLLSKAKVSSNKTDTKILTKPFSTEQLNVEHDTVNNMFVIKLENDLSKKNDIAFVQYDKLNGVLHYFETQVPPSFQGRGVAKILAKAAFDHIVKNDLRMKVSCTYLQKYLLENARPEYTSRIVE